MASVSLEFSAFLDPRYRLLGDLSGQSRFDAIGRMAVIWAYCIEKNQSILLPVLIDAMAEVKGYSGWLVEAGLGDAQADGNIRVKGTEGRIEYLAKARLRQRVATEAATRKREGKSYPIKSPKLDSKSDPSLVSSSTSSSASTSKEVNTLVQGKRGTIYTLDFEQIYSRYPRHEGKAGGFKIYQQLDRSVYPRLAKAIENYASQCLSEKRERHYVKQFSSFMANWQDYEISASGGNLVRSRPLLSFGPLNESESI